jgi:hypothetical protein
VSNYIYKEFNSRPAIHYYVKVVMFMVRIVMEWMEILEKKKTRIGRRVEERRKGWVKKKEGKKKMKKIERIIPN